MACSASLAAPTKSVTINCGLYPFNEEVFILNFGEYADDFGPSLMVLKKDTTKFLTDVRDTDPSKVTVARRRPPNCHDVNDDLAKHVAWKTEERDAGIHPP